MSLFKDTENITISSDGTGTNPICIRQGGLYNVSISGSFAGTITLQRTFQSVSDTTQNIVWNDIRFYTNSAEDVCFDGNCGTWVRLYVKTGNFGGGVINARISYSGVGSHIPYTSSTYVPTLDLDFTQYSGLNPAITFTRASSGTYYDANGVLQTATTNAPRFDHNPSTLANLGLLVEGAGTNLHTYSEGITSWVAPSNASLSSAGAAPSGATTAYALIEDTSTGLHRISAPNTTITAGSTITLSAYVKAVSSARYFGVSVAGGGGRYCYVKWDVSGAGNTLTDAETGSVTYTLSGQTITLINNGWYRVTATIVSATDTVISEDWRIQSSSHAQSYTGNGTNGFYIWGAQLEQNSFTTSYIPTTTAAASRAADVCTMPTSGWFNARKIK